MEKKITKIGVLLIISLAFIVGMSGNVSKVGVK